MDKTTLLLVKTAPLKRWEDEEKSTNDVDQLRRDFQQRLHPESVPWPPAPGKLDIDALIVKAKEAVGKDYDDIFVFVATFLNLREIDRHLRTLNGMRHDMEWLNARISKATSTESPQRAVWGATLAWLQTETTRHNSAVTQLRIAVANAKASHAKAAAAAELAARPTFGEWFVVARQS